MWVPEAYAAFLNRAAWGWELAISVSGKHLQRFSPPVQPRAAATAPTTQVRESSKENKYFAWFRIKY